MWKERIKELLEEYKNITDHYVDQEYSEDKLEECMLILAKEVHEKACEDQKEICWKKALIFTKDGMNFIDDNSILYAPNAKFE